MDFNDVIDPRSWGESYDGETTAIGYTTESGFIYDHVDLVAGFGAGGVVGSYADGNDAKFLLGATAWEHSANIDFFRDYLSPDYGIVQASINPTAVLGLTKILPATGTEITGSMSVIATRTMTPEEENWIYVHEIGHALGLQHPLAGDGATIDYNNSMTVMSDLTFGGMLASTPMYFDNLAIQAKYGTNLAYHNTDTTIAVDESAKLFTIWDGGGIDTITASGSIGGNVVDLREISIVSGGSVGVSAGALEHGSHVEDIYGSISYFWIAYGAHIENVVGGGGNDTIYGSDAFTEIVIGNAHYTASNGANALVGGGGDDKIYGGSGHDTLYGDTGNDVLEGGAGDDKIFGGADTDTILFNGTFGNDEITGGEILKVDGNVLSGVATQVSGNFYHLADGTSIEKVDAATLVIHEASNTIKLLDWSTTHNYGITLKDDETTGTSVHTGWIRQITTQQAEGVNLGDLHVVPAGYTGIIDNVGIVQSFSQSYKLGGEGGPTVGYEVYKESYMRVPYTGTTNGLYVHEIFHSKIVDIVTDSNFVPDEDGTWSRFDSPSNNVILTDLNHNGYDDRGEFDIAAGVVVGTGQADMFNSLATGAGGTMIGSAGFDTYTFGSGSGAYTVIDSDHQGAIVVGGVVLGGGSAHHDAVYVAPNVWSLDGHQLTLSGTNLIIDAALSNYITVADFHSGNLGIVLDTPAVANQAVGGSAADDALLGDAGNDTLEGFDGNDVLYGGAGNDQLYGSAGDDTIVGGAGSDYIDGGIGNNTLSFEGSSTWVSANLATNNFWNGDAAWDNVTNIQNLAGSAYGDYLGGDANANLLDGRDANDSLEGGDGGDTLIGGSGDDLLFGGDGDDRIIGGLGSDYVDGGAGNNTLSFESSSAWVSADLANNNYWNGDAAWDNATHIQNLAGSAFDDYLYGDAIANHLSGGDGDDHLEGRGGSDMLSGGNGNDIFVFNAGDAIGTAIITDFQGAGTSSGDVIQISSGIYSTAAIALSHMTYSGGDATLDLGGGHAVHLVGVTSMALSDLVVV